MPIRAEALRRFAKRWREVTAPLKRQYEELSEASGRVSEDSIPIAMLSWASTQFKKFQGFLETEFSNMLTRISGLPFAIIVTDSGADASAASAVAATQEQRWLVLRDETAKTVDWLFAWRNEVTQQAVPLDFAHTRSLLAELVGPIIEPFLSLADRVEAEAQAGQGSRSAIDSTFRLDLAGTRTALGAFMASLKEYSERSHIAWVDDPQAEILQVPVSTSAAALTPMDFERLVGELLRRMGLHVQLTKGSWDGGVDCIATDPRPVVGGKIVVQAKYYTGTVSAAAVRDLYGTMHSERAAKGVLITTGSFGPSSYDFARDKPLELIDGKTLLYLLASHFESA